jgi:hypothetical protein
MNRSRFLYICESKSIVMTTLTLKIDKRTKAGKAFLAMSEPFLQNVEGIEVVERVSNRKTKEENLYNPEFVKMILERYADIKSGKSKCITIDPDDVWGSLGLK